MMVLDRANGQQPDASTTQRHIPVLLEQVVDFFRPPLSAQTQPVIVDATLGMAGHAAKLLETYPDTQLIGLDRDPQAIKRVTVRLAELQDRIHIVHTTFDHIAEVVQELSPAGVDAILLDLGVSSFQLDESTRGFSYAQDVALDMRMDPTQTSTAAIIVNTYSVNELTRIIAEYGEERFARRIAMSIVRRREKAPLTSSSELAEIIRDAIPAPARRTGGHPAKRTFQALRIEVNQELELLKAALPAALKVLRVGGRIAVLAYHSLEDRIVKQAFAQASKSTSPEGLPIELPGTEPEFAPITRDPLTPTAEEIQANPRAASAKMRVLQRIREA